MSNKPFKFHWGHGIILTFLAFAAFMSYFYVNMSKEKIDLVGDHYYEDGQKFEQKQRLLQQTNQLPDKVSFQIDNISKQLLLKIPAETSDIKVDLFFMPDASKDQHLHKTNPKNYWAIPLEGLPAGNWRISIKWIHQKKEYLQEDRFNLLSDK